MTRQKHSIQLYESYNLDELNDEINRDLDPDIFPLWQNNGETVKTHITFNTIYDPVVGKPHYSAMIEYCIE